MKPDFVMSTYINCSQDAAWDALTKSALVSAYHFACTDVRGDYAAEGDTQICYHDNGAVLLTHRVIAITPKTRLEVSFHPSWGEDETPSRCVYTVEPVAAGVKLSIEHFGLTAAQRDGIHDGWSRILSGLKTYLETGTAHRFVTETV